MMIPPILARGAGNRDPTPIWPRVVHFYPLSYRFTEFKLTCNWIYYTCGKNWHFSIVFSYFGEI